MEFGSILLTLAIALLVGVYVTRPLTERTEHAGENREIINLYAERERVLDAMLELEADLSLGKLPEETFSRQRQALALQGAQVLRQLDKSPASPDRQAASGLEAELESAVAQFRAGSDGFCPHCGKPAVAKDRFCANCGATLKEQRA